MKPDLKSYCINDLTCSGILPIPRDLISKIEKLAPPDETSKISMFMESYAGHDGLLYLDPINTRAQEQDTQEYYLNCQYNTRSGRSQRHKGIPRPRQCLEILSNQIYKVTLNCRASFSFSKRSKRKILIDFPLTLGTMPNMPFNRIIGIHVAKMNGNESEHDVIVDVSDKNSIWMSTGFQYQSTIDDAMLANVIAKALSICSLFVSQEEADAESKGC